jgi:hypothetical protein
MAKKDECIDVCLPDYINCFILCFCEYFFRLPNVNTVREWLLDLKWTPELAVQWQEFYNNAARTLRAGRAGQLHTQLLPALPRYQDLPSEKCQKSAGHQRAFNILLIFISFFVRLFYV